MKKGNMVLLVGLSLLLCGCRQSDSPVSDPSSEADGETIVQSHLFVEASGASSQENSADETETNEESASKEEEEISGETPGTAAGAGEGDSDTSATSQEESVQKTTTAAASVSLEGSFEAGDCGIEIKGVFLEVGMDFLPYINTVGSNVEIVEGQACLDGGYDTNYYYGSDLAVYTYASGGKQIIYDIYVTGSSYTTAKGARIGTTTKDEIIASYGEPSGEAAAAYRYSLSGSSTVVTFSFSGDVLKSVDILDTSVNG